MAIAVFFAVRLIMFLVVADQIMQCKSVVGGDEVDARIGLPAVVAVEIARTRESIAQVADLAGIAFPKTPCGVAIRRVPFGPENREIADLIPARAEIPRLGNELHLRDDRILLDDIEKGAQPVNVVKLARQGGCQIEARSEEHTSEHQSQSNLVYR